MSNDLGIHSINKLSAVIIGVLISAMIFTAVYLIFDNLEKISPNSAASEIIDNGRNAIGILQAAEEAAPFITILIIFLVALFYIVNKYGRGEP